MTWQLKVVYSRPRTDRPVMLEIEGLAKSFENNGRPVPVLRDLSFTVRQGEIVCILGRSGCGKTTFLKMLAGFLKPDRGTILLSGSAVVKPGPERGVIFQEDALFPWLTVRENIAFGLKGRGKAENAAEVERFIDLVGLRGFDDYLPDEISGGMKQRVALARVLIMRPRVLLLDEPFAALDAQTRADMQDLLLTLCRQLSHTVLFVTHDVEEAVLLADRVLLFDRARRGLKDDIPVTMARPRSRRDKAFVCLCGEIVRFLKDGTD
jgi:NitT/TauT family transport system ATP-binding protein